MLAGDPKTKIAKYLVLAGIATITSAWWQPYVLFLLEKVFGFEIEVISTNENRVYIGGWILIGIGVFSYWYVISKTSSSPQEQSDVREIAKLTVGELHSSWELFSDHLQITDMVRDNHRKLDSEAQKKGFSSYISHVKQVEMKKRVYLSNLQKLRIMKDRLEDKDLITTIEEYWKCGAELCNDCLKEKEDRSESVESCNASFKKLNKIINEHIKNT